MTDQHLDHPWVDIHRLLAERREIAVIWSWEDVQTIRPDLTPDQCWETLQAVERHHDAGVGISWHLLQDAAIELFGEEPEEVCHVTSL